MIHERWRCRTLAGCLLAAALALLPGCQTPPKPVVVVPKPLPPPVTADMSFDTVSRHYLDEMLELTPVKATALGDHRHDDELDDVSPDGYARRVALARALIAQLKGIDVTKLSRAHQVDIRLLSNELQYQIWRVEQLQEWRWNPLLYTELAHDGIYLLMARDFAPLPDRLRSVTARLTELPRLLAQARESLVPARVPRVNAETAVKQNAAVMSVIEHYVEPQVGALPQADQDALKTAIEHARTALTQHQLWLEKLLLPQAKGNFRLGAQLYDIKLRFALQSSLSRSDIRTRAEAEMTRTRQEMYDIARSVLASRPHGPHLPATPSAQQQQRSITAALELAYAQHPQRGELVDTARQAVDAERTFVRAQDLVTVYDDPLEIVPIPAVERDLAPPGCDEPGPLDKGLKTFFALAPVPQGWNARQARAYLREYNTRAIYALTIREVMPGHYLQVTHAMRYGSPLRAVLASPIFVQGWAVYAERLMIEQGFRGNDPLLRLIMLKGYLRDIADALLDQAVHVDGMPRDAAVHLMMHDAFEEQQEAQAEWLRAELTSAQLPADFVGFQEHLALRDEAHQRWGAAFTLKRYHDAVLGYGAPPIRYVRELIFNLPIE